jgi:hypothetical protein
MKITKYEECKLAIENKDQENNSVKGSPVVHFWYFGTVLQYISRLYINRY